MAKKYSNSGFSYQKKFVPASKRAKSKKTQSTSQKKSLYTENWDEIRRACYKRDGHRCVMCGIKGKLSAHHVVPVRISHNNSLSNLVSLCSSCHKKIEEVGFSILQNGGRTADIRRIEFGMIAEAKKKRREDWAKKQEQYRLDEEAKQKLLPPPEDEK